MFLQAAASDVAKLLLRLVGKIVICVSLSIRKNVIFVGTSFQVGHRRCIASAALR
jgi:hypothetical protein